MKTELSILESVLNNKNSDFSDVYNCAAGTKQNFDGKKMAAMLYSVETIKKYDNDFISEIIKAERSRI